MPKQRTLRHFKAALFETVSQPRRVELILRLMQGEKETLDLLGTSDAALQTELTEHVAVLVGNRILRRREEGDRVFYSLVDPNLGKAIELIAGNPAWPVALAHPARIEILEFLAARNFSQNEILRRLEADERPQGLHHLEVLVSTRLITREGVGPDCVYSIELERVPEVLCLLREYFDNHLVEALMMVSQISFQHIHDEATQLKAVLTKGTTLNRQ